MAAIFTRQRIVDTDVGPPCSAGVLACDGCDLHPPTDRYHVEISTNCPQWKPGRSAVPGGGRRRRDAGATIQTDRYHVDISTNCPQCKPGRSVVPGGGRRRRDAGATTGRSDFWRAGLPPLWLIPRRVGGEGVKPSPTVPVGWIRRGGFYTRPTLATSFAGGMSDTRRPLHPSIIVDPAVRTSTRHCPH